MLFLFSAVSVCFIGLAAIAYYMVMLDMDTVLHISPPNPRPIQYIGKSDILKPTPVGGKLDSLYKKNIHTFKPTPTFTIDTGKRLRFAKKTISTVARKAEFKQVKTSHAKNHGGKYKSKKVENHNKHMHKKQAPKLARKSEAERRAKDVVNTLPNAEYIVPTKTSPMAMTKTSNSHPLPKLP
ncbi:hypothetical protein AX774_g97 [Zancudomyces culisetae]|uniref:Uncharacterized protein n=1 Tax=Zancudomyces culisetae TaxID=1213189 RepID=A0A1R1PZG8_ZANCU|nr:hypothetical protein AX774_g97 [Zancudomyces culisetae]|eukprot:OMH86339.1 hypothetical protein AX774_g97 [Zancudomyces culisetae]